MKFLVIMELLVVSLIIFAVLIAVFPVTLALIIAYIYLKYEKEIDSFVRRIVECGKY